MKYMVMECHLSYAVVLDEDGRFLNVANRNYEVGQTVTDVIAMQDTLPEVKKSAKTRYKWFASVAAMAACLMLVVTGVFQYISAPFGSVYMTINPEVRIDVNRKDTVVAIEGVNDDGKNLIQDYSYKKKDLDLVMDELVDRAIDMDYLHEGGQITLTLDGKDSEWVINKSEAVGNHVSEHLTDKFSVTIEITNTGTKNQGVVIPVVPDSKPDTNYSEADYGQTAPSQKPTTPPASGNNNGAAYDDTDYGPNNDGVTDYNDTDYGPNNDGVTDYNDTDYGPNNDGVTDYNDTDYGPNNDGVTDYSQSTEGTSNYNDTSDDGGSGYEDYGSNYGSNYGTENGDSGYDD